jgi:hypothetical protein
MASNKPYWKCDIRCIIKIIALWQALLSEKVSTIYAFHAIVGARCNEVEQARVHAHVRACTHQCVDAKR